MRKFIAAIILFAAAPLSAQQFSLDIPGLADKAKSVVDVTLDGPLLRMAAKFLSSSDPDERAARDVVQKLQGIYVRSYQFEHEGEYDMAVVDRARAQVASWKRIVTVTEKHRENTGVYVNMRGEDVIGLAIISTEPRELTLVNIVGPIDLDKLSQLEGQFGIPHMKTRKHDDE
jgi:Domain of unknown function (DUF4252)